MKVLNDIKKIIVISDTHIPTRAKKLPDEFFSYLKNTDLIIHCGDMVKYDLIIELSAYSKVIGVKGNMDEPDIPFPYEETIKINNKFTFCMTHGSGAPFDLDKKVYEKFKNENPDIILFGHSHIPVNKTYNKTILFNPGSLTSGIFKNSFGIIDLNKSSIKGKIIYI